MLDLLERARAIAACPLFEGLAPAVVVRLAERAHVAELVPGERRTTEDTIWVVARGVLGVAVREDSTDVTASILRRRGAPATPGHALGLVRVVRSGTPIVEAMAQEPSVLVGIGFDDIRDVLEEDPAALAAIADRLAALLSVAA